MLDGHHVSATEHRLKALRGTWAAPFPGQALVVLDQQRLVIPDVVLHEDGHAQERRLIPAVLHTVNAGDLWIEDRNCCTLGMLFGLAQRGAARRCDANTAGSRCAMRCRGLLSRWRFAKPMTA